MRASERLVVQALDDGDVVFVDDSSGAELVVVEADLPDLVTRMCADDRIIGPDLVLTDGELPRVLWALGYFAGIRRVTS